MRLHVSRVLAMVVAMLVVVSGSWAGPGPGALRNFTYVMAYPLVTLDPANSEDSGSPHAIVHVTEPLIMVGSDNKLRPHLAVSWKANADATVWTVKLRQGVKFTDGTPFNAQAVKFNFDRLVDPKAPMKMAGRADNIKAVEVVDEHTVNYIMKGPYSQLPFLLSQTYLFVLSPRAVRELGPEIASKAVGTGPFRVERFISNEGAVLVRNPNYWGEMGNIGRIEIKRVSEYTTRRLMLENGEADVIQEVIPEDVEALSKLRGVKVRQRSSTRQYMVSMNALVKPFDNRRVRQALNYAVDKERIVKYLFRSTATVNDSPVPPSVEGYVPMKPYPYDPEKARQLLREAGYSNGFKANMWGPSPGRIVMGSETVEQIQADLAKVGVQLTITEADAAAQIRRITLPPKQSEEAGKHLMYLGGPAARGVQLFFEDFFTTASWAPKGSNRGFYGHARVDGLVKQAGQIGDPAKRQAIYADIQRILWDDAPWIYLFTISLLWGHRDRVEGLEFMPNDIVLLTKATVR